MKNILRWISWQKVVFFIVLGTVIYQNKLSAGQYLSGWDNLQPEINFGLEVSRQLSAVWQEFRGLGHLGGMGHAADLPRTLILWLFSWIVPTQLLRWSWHIAMLILGPIGIWYMGRRLWKWGELACFSASTFYLLSMATVQYFYTPYEAFSATYGFLPWLITTFILFLESGKKSDGIKLLAISILGTTAFYVQTLFVVYVLILGIISVAYLPKWKRVLGGWLVVVGANAFWLLPVIYFVVSNAGVVGVSKINSIASPETVYMNEAMGGWRDVLSMRGFWIEYVEWKGNEWGRLLQAWYGWANGNVELILSLSIAGLSIVGMEVGAIKKRVGWWVSVVFILAFIMLSSNNPPFGFAYTYLTEKVPFFGEMFRSMFTKWSMVMGLVMALGVGVFTEFVSIKKWIGIVATFVVLGLVGYVAWPIFTGNLIFQSMKIEYPKGYEKLYGFFQDKDKNARIAYLPSAWAWGWQYHDWGYRGSGFLWYGIEQPILDRAFDVWSPYNEGFYNEFSTALYSCNPVRSDLVGSEKDLQPTRSDLGCKEQVTRVLEKYDARYVLLDESVIAPGQDKEILRIEETKKLAEELGWQEVFKDGFLTVWDRGDQDEKFVSAPASYTWLEAETSKVRRDIAWEGVGTYVSDNRETQGVGESDNSESRIVYPFAGLMREEIKNVEYGESRVTISSEHSLSQGSELRVPGWQVGDIVRINYLDGKPLPAYKINGQNGPVFRGKEKPEDGKSYIVAMVSKGEEWEEYLQDARFHILDSRIEITVEGEEDKYDFAKQGQGTIGNCDVLKRGTVQKIGANYSADERGAVCDYVIMPELDTRLSYLMRMQGDNKAGRSLKFFLYNTGSKRNDLEYLLGKYTYDQTFSLLPWEFDGNYTLNIETRSFGQYAENKVSPVEVRWLPLEQIAGVRIIKSNGETPPASGVPTRDSLASPVEESPQVQSDLVITKVQKYGTWLYIVETKNGGLLKLSQGYDEGWVSPWLEHVKVDGWANGWMVPEGEHRIVIFYWPQLLEYLGFVILGVTIIVLVRHKD